MVAHRSIQSRFSGSAGRRGQNVTDTDLGNPLDIHLLLEEMLHSNDVGPHKQCYDDNHDWDRDLPEAGKNRFNCVRVGVKTNSTYKASESGK